MDLRHSYDLGKYVPTGHYTLLYYVVEQVFQENGFEDHGVALEFGVGKGESTRIIANRIHTIGFDSFKGLPEDWREDYPAGSFAQDHIPLIENTEMVVGLFQDTLATVSFLRNIRLVHIDCDLYSSTKAALDWLKCCSLTGIYFVFDEWFGYEGCEDHEQKAWREFAADTGINWEVIGHSHEQWAIYAWR